jgi:hypothetical protein
MGGIFLGLSTEMSRIKSYIPVLAMPAGHRVGTAEACDSVLCSNMDSLFPQTMNGPGCDPRRLTIPLV